MTLRLVPIPLLAIAGVIASLGMLTEAPAEAPVALAVLQTTAQLTQTAVALTQTAAVPTATPAITASATGTPSASPTATTTASPSPTLTLTATPTVTPTPAVLPDLTITKFDLTDPAAPGDLLTYSITVTNSIASGPTSNATVMTDEIPAGTAFNSASGPGCTTVGSMVSCSVPPLAPGQSQVYSIVVQVTGASGTTITNLARVDEPANLVIELNETNNTAVATTLIGGPTPTTTPFPTATALPPEPTPVPPEPTPIPPDPTPFPSADTVWARILFPSQTYSTTDDLLWIAQPGELYWVSRQEGGWILGVWEGDTRAWSVWFRVDRVELLTLDRLAPPEAGQLWLVVFQPVQTYSLTIAPLWVARPGEWYQVVRRESGWTLGRWEGDPPDFVVWIPEGPQVEFATLDLPH